MNGGISVLNVKTFKTDVLVSSTLLVSYWNLLINGYTYQINNICSDN